MTINSMKAFGLLLVAFVAFIALNVTLAGTAMAADPAPVIVNGFVQDPVTGVVEPGYVVAGITYLTGSISSTRLAGDLNAYQIG